MLEESATKTNIKSATQCESLTIIACYASRIMGAYGRFYCMTIFQFVHWSPPSRVWYPVKGFHQ